MDTNGARECKGVATRASIPGNNAGNLHAFWGADVPSALRAGLSAKALASAVQRYSPELGIDQLEVALYQGGEPGDKVRRVLCYYKGKARVDRTELPGPQLLDRVPSAARPTPTLVSSLNSGADAFGILCLETKGPSALVQETLRASLSAALSRLRSRDRLP